MFIRSLGRAAGLTLVASRCFADVTWTGGGADKNWSTPANWSVALNNPTTDRVVFASTDTSDTVAKNMDADWTVGGLRAIQNGGTHILNLCGRTLTIGTNGDLYVQRASSGAAVLVISNGAVLVTNRIYAEQGSYLIITNGATLGGPFRNVYVGTGGNGYMHFTGGSASGGVFETGNIQIGGNNSEGRLVISPGSITTIRVHTNFFLNSTGAAGKQRGAARIGWPDPARGNQWYLPYGVNIRIGSPSARGRLHVHYITSIYDGGTFSRLATTGGGQFEAWLSELIVSETWGTENGSTGILDLAGMDAFWLDAVEARLGTSVSNGTRASRAWVYFPAGTARFDRVYMGDSVNAGSYALLDLSNTVCAISQTLQMKTSGRINIRVWDRPAGLDLSNDVSLVCQGSARITVTFNSAPGPGVDPLWGIRQAGNHAAELGSLAQSGTILLQKGSFAGSNDYKTCVFHDSGSGFTYAALVTNTMTVPPAVKAKDISVEVDGESTIRITPADMILAVYNPDSLSETNRTISCPGYMGGAEQPYIDFATSGPLPVTNENVTVKIYYEGGVTAQDSAKAVFVPIAAPVLTNVTWQGLARNYAYLDRREWKWGANWVGNRPPSNPTPATVIFEDLDALPSVAKLLPPVPNAGGVATDAWTVGNIRVGNLSGGHTLDLGGRTLRTSGEFRVERLVGSGASYLVCSNGTLDVGSQMVILNSTVTLHNVSITVPAQGTVTVSSASTAVFTNGTSINGKFLKLAVGVSGNGILDMRQATVRGGTLDLCDLQVGGGGAGSEGYLYFTSNTLQTIRVASNFFLNSQEPLAGMQRGAGLVGAPDPTVSNLWFLPRGVNIYIGSPSARGRLRVHKDDSSYGGTKTSRLVASGGGVFEAWLTELTVAYTKGSNEGNPVGILDLRAVDSFFAEADSVSIGEDLGTRGTRGEVLLPPGTAVFGTLTMGRVTNPAPLGASYAILELNDTIVAVTNSATLSDTARVRINVYGNRASGLILPGLPSVSNGASVVVTFIQPPTHQGLHYGLKVAGRVAAALQAATWLSWNDSAIGGRALIYEYQGNTYLGLPPSGGTVFVVH